MTLPHHAGISTNVNAPPVAATEWNALIDAVNALVVTSSILVICTSSTRPASPATGRLIYETDTLQFVIYNGTSWVYPPTKSAYSKYTGTGTSIASSAWIPVPFATLAAGAGTGITVTGTNTIFTLAAGLWHAEFTCNMDQAAHTGVTGGFFALCSSNATPVGNAYAQDNSPVNSGQVSGNVSADILSNGSAQVVAQVFAANAATVLMTSNAVLPTLTLNRLPN